MNTESKELIVFALLGALVVVALGWLTRTPLNGWAGFGLMLPFLIRILWKRKKRS